MRSIGNSLFFINKILLIFFQTSPLQWWRLNRHKYPILAILARRYLAIPATSAPSERFFSIGALVLSKLRNRMHMDTFEFIMCLKSWGLYSNDLIQEGIHDGGNGIQIQNIEGDDFNFAI